MVLQSSEHKITWQLAIRFALDIAQGMAVCSCHLTKLKVKSTCMPAMLFTVCTTTTFLTLQGDLKSSNLLVASLDPNAESTIKITDFVHVNMCCVDNSGNLSNCRQNAHWVCENNDEGSRNSPLECTRGHQEREIYRKG